MRQETVGEKILWLAGLICMPRWKAAFRSASDRAKKRAGYDAGAALREAGDVSKSERFRIMGSFAAQFRDQDPVLALAFEMLALRTTDAPAVIHAAVSGANGLLCGTAGDTAAARARLRIWADVARGKYTTADDADFFEIANCYWSAEMQRIVATSKNAGHPALEALIERRWDDALSVLYAATVTAIGLERLKPIGTAGGDRDAMQGAISDLVEHLYAIGVPHAGRLAMAWQMLTADPRRPASFVCFLPQLQHALDGADDIDEQLAAALRDRIRIWWRTAEGEWTESEVSIFRIAAVETSGVDSDVDDLDPQPSPPPRWTSIGVIASVDQMLGPEFKGPTVVVMPHAAAEERGLPTPWRELRDVALPLVVCRDVSRIRDVLRAEYPHAWSAVGMLLQDLREGEPAQMRPTILLGQPGSGKSRLVRRLAELLGMYVYRFDGAASHDGTYAGSPKSWSSAQPSVPARAIMMSRVANPIALVDEIERAGESTYNGNLWSAMTPFLERETSCRYRETGIDAEMNLAHVNHAATANTIDRLPAQLRDRYRIIRIPSPTLTHLPKLAANVMADMAGEDEARTGDQPLAGDELEVIGRAWAAQKFSIRKLQAIVRATLEARDQHAMRH